MLAAAFAVWAVTAIEEEAGDMRMTLVADEVTLVAWPILALLAGTEVCDGGGNRIADGADGASCTA